MWDTNIDQWSLCFLENNEKKKKNFAKNKMSKKEEKKSKATKTTSNNSLTINEEELKKLNKLTKGSFIWLCCWNSGQILCAPWDHLLSTASDDAWKQSGLNESNLKKKKRDFN